MPFCFWGGEWDEKKHNLKSTDLTQLLPATITKARNHLLTLPTTSSLSTNSFSQSPKDLGVHLRQV